MQQKLLFNLTKVLLLVALLTGVNMWGQLTLPAGTSYTQNFDAIGSGLPTGWTVRTGATSGARGTAQTLATAATVWTSTTGNFRNSASSEGLTSASDATAQSSSTDRALGVRMTGSFGDPGAAFELQLANTTLKTGFSLQVKHQMLDVQPRTNSWLVQYSTNGTSWTTIGTYNDTGAFGSTTGNYSFGTALDNLSGNVYIRIATLTSAGTGNRDTYGIDDFVLSWSETGPSLSTNVSSLTSFGSVNVGANSTSSSFTVSGSSLTADAVVTAPSTDFQVSLDNSVFSSSVQIPFGSGTLTNVPVYVRFIPQSGGAKSGNVTVASTGATSRTVAVSGTGVGPSAALSGTLNEATLNGASFTIGLTNDTFINPLSTAGFTLNNAPSGVSIASVTYLNATTATVVLAYNDTDFDANASMSVTIAGSQLTSNAQLTSGNITVNFVTESLSSATTVAFGSVCINTTSDLNFTLSGTNLKAGNISLAALSGFTYSTTSNGTYTSTLTIAHAGGALSQTVYVRFAPTAVLTYSGNIVISGGGAPSFNRGVTGFGVNTAPTVTTPTSANVLATSATLGGNITAAGCGTITERGIYYSTTNGFANGAGTKVSETGTFTTGIFTVPVTGLLPNTVYYYKAFAINGGGAGYSTQGTFTTPTQAVTVPYTQNFEGTVTDFYYEVYPGSGTTNAWAIGTGTNNGGTKALYISNNGGTTNAYSNSTTYTGAKLRVDLTNQTAATLTFDWKSLGESDANDVYDFGEVYVTAGGTEYLLSDDYEFINSASFTTKQLNLTPYVGGIVEIEFYWQNDNVVNQDPPFAIDNISITSGSAPVVTTAAATSIDQVAAILGGNVTNNGGSTVTARGVVYNTTGNPTLSDMSAAMGTGTGSFQAEVNGLADNTTYYVKAYATNAFGTEYGDEVQFTTTILPAPVATEETTLTAGGIGFTANWEAVEGEASYRLDVSTSSTFGTTTPTTVTEGFSGGTTTPATGYTYTGLSTYGTAVNAGAAVPSMQFNDTNDQMVTPVLSGAITQFSFWAKGNATNTTSALLIEGYNGSSWVTIQNVNNFTTASGTTYTYSSATTPALPANITQLRFTYSKSSGNIGFDDLSINYNATTLNVLPGYNNLTVSGTSQAVTGLTDGTTYYYRVRAVSANSTSLNSNTITAFADSVYEWNGTAWNLPGTPTAADVAIIAGNYNTATDGVFGVNNLIINSGIFTVATGTTFTVQNQIINNASASNFVVENDATLLQVNDVDNIGNATVYRYTNELFRLDYTIWSAPVTGQNLFSFSPGTQITRFYTYGNNAENTGTEFLSVSADDNYADNGGTPNFVPGRGYLIRMPNTLTDQMSGYPASTADYNAGTFASIFEGQFAGVPNNGDVTLPYMAQGKFNIVGNPYPSPINVQDFFADNAANLDPGYGLYFWRKKNNADATSYAVLTADSYIANDGGVESPDGEYTYGGQQWESYYNGTLDENWTIAPGQGFFVRAAAGATGISFNNQMRQAPQPGQPFYRNGSDVPVQKSKLWFNLTAPGMGFSQASVVYNPSSTLGIDAGKDARHFGTSGLTALFTFAADETLAIQSRPDFDVNDVVPLGYRVNTAGTYTIKLHRMEGVFEGDQQVYLRDNVLNVIHNIKEGDYTFTTEQGTFNSRFDILYTNEVLGDNDNVIDADAVVVYRQDNLLTIITGNELMQSVTVYDLRGRELYRAQAVNSQEHTINGLPIQQQVLLVQVTTPKGTVTKKVIY